MMTARKWAKWLFTALCAIPWLIIFGAYFEICVARLALSRWPRALTDDPNIVAMEPLHLLVLLLFLSLVVAIPLVVVLAAWNWRKTSERLPLLRLNRCIRNRLARAVDTRQPRPWKYLVLVLRLSLNTIGIGSHSRGLTIIGFGLSPVTETG
jgi:hypothetical protein